MAQVGSILLYIIYTILLYINLFHEIYFKGTLCLYAQFCLHCRCGTFHFGHRGLETPITSKFDPKMRVRRLLAPKCASFLLCRKGVQVRRVRRVLAPKCASFLSLCSAFLPRLPSIFGANLEVFLGF